MITIPIIEYRQLVRDAACWRALWDTGHLVELIDREVYRRIREASWAISGAREWGAADTAVNRRRRMISTVTCGLCGRSVTVVHPLADWQYARLPDVSWARCPDCAERDDGLFTATDQRGYDARIPTRTGPDPAGVPGRPRK